jgi:hypothetical protein
VDLRQWIFSRSEWSDRPEVGSVSPPTYRSGATCPNRNHLFGPHHLVWPQHLIPKCWDKSAHAGRSGGATCPNRWEPPVRVAPLPGVVRAEGFEPPRLSSLEPKSSASTSSATPAMGRARREPIRRAARLISWRGTPPHQKNGPARGCPWDGLQPPRRRAPRPAGQILAATRLRPTAAAAIADAIPRLRLRRPAPPRWSPAAPPDCSRPRCG